MVNGQTKLAALIGKPVEHSLSPAMHNAAFKKQGLNFSYMAFEVDNLPDAVNGIRALGIRGANVTMPHKIDVLEQLNEIDDQAREIGAVNTIVNNDGVLAGYNTDSIGAVNALEAKAKLRGKKIVIIGAGGAGRAIAHGLAKKKAKITIVDRNEGPARELAAKIGGNSAAPFDLQGIDADILINASPVGMKPNVNKMPVPASFLWKGLLVFDIVYDPIETKLIKTAKRKGCKTILGIEMLVGQGAASYELWTGQKAPVKEMQKAVLKALKARK